MKTTPLLRLFCLLLFCTSTVRADVGDMTTLSIAAGEGHGLALRSDGTVWAWGENVYGPLGVPSVTFADFPLRVAGLSNIVSIAAGADHSLAVQSNGTVWAWGTNDYGQLGTGNLTWSTVPVQVVGITNAVAVAGGGFERSGSHSLALLSNGRVMAWGYNGYGELGNGTFTESEVPVLVTGLSNVIQIKAGIYHSMALTSNGQVWCWGLGAYGQVGNGSNNYYTNATQTLSLSNIVNIAAGGLHSLALKSDGTVWAWGENGNGQLGLGSTNNTATATKISTLANATAIGASAYSSAATLAPSFLTGTNAQTMAWGYQYSTVPDALGQAPVFTQLAPGYEPNYGNDYFLGLTAGGAVYAWGVNSQGGAVGTFGDGNSSNPSINSTTVGFFFEPTLSFTATPVPRWGEFLRSALDDLNYCTIVVPIDLEQGIPLNATGNDQYAYTNSKPWFLSTSNQTLYLANAITTGTNLLTYPTANPIVAFGSQGNGSPLFVNQPYRFGVYAGGMDESTGAATNVIQISVYDATKYTNGVTTNMVPTNVFTIALPRRTVAADSNAWYSFMTNGASKTFTSNGLTTTVEFLDDGFTNANEGPLGLPFGLTWFSNGGPAPQMTNFDLVAYKLTHTATNTNYFYCVSVLGKVQVATNTLAPMATNAAGAWTATPLYTLDFQQPSPLQSMYVDRLFFQGTPMPPTYEDATTAGPAGLTIMVTNIVSLTNTIYTNLDASPELRISPILNQFVSDMNNNPLALASYVINEIGLTDPYASAQSNQVVAASINCGGIDRSAQATFLEGQGSPIEQCALLVYLLRQAGYPAAYVFPTNGNLLMSDSHISQLWRMQVSGVLTFLGIPYVTNSFLTADYPWVVANIGTNTVHIFPWIKDTAIVQGVNLYDYMPPNYSTALDWVEQYVRANSNIMSLNSENLPAVLFPAFVQQCLLTNAEGASISLDDVGVTAYDRPHQFPAWSYLPQPDYVTNLNTLAIVDSLTDSATTYPFLSNIFNTAEIKVYNTTGSTSNLLMDTGVWDSCDFHDRKLLLFTNNSQICLWMAPYRPNITTVQTFTNGAPSSTALQSNYFPVLGITNLTVDVIHKRRAAYLSQPTGTFPLSEGIGSTNVAKCSTYEVAGIALDFGRVTPAMLQPYENFYWGLQLERAATNTFIPPVQDYQGTAAYLLAMGYYQKNDVFDALNRQWHGIQGLINFGSGLGTVGNPSQTNMQARVDMTIQTELLIANGSLRPDSGVPDFSVPQNYYTLSIVNGSAQEHDILQTMFPDQNAVSTVRLLQLAQLQGTNGNSPILELVNNNYLAQGNASHSGYGATALKSISPAIWTAVTNMFNQPDGPYARALITPGLVTNVGGSFGGMGVLALSAYQWQALISSNSVIYNGGYGGVINSFTTTGSGVDFNYNLTVNPDSTPSFSYNSTVNNVASVFSSLDSASLPTTGSTYAFTTSETSGSSVILGQYNISGGTATGIEQAANTGFFGTAWASIDGDLDTVAEPVDVPSGAFYIDTVDLSLPGPFPLQLRRNYVSQNPGANEFGYGWKMNFMPFLVVTTNATSQSVIYAAELNGAVIAYHQTNTSGPWVVLPQDNPSLNNNSIYGRGASANMFNAVLNLYTTNGDTYVIKAPDGSVRTYQQTTFPVTSGGNQMNRNRPYLTQWQDHFGNYAQFFYGTNSSTNDYGQLNRINMANGNDLVFKYDFYGRVIQAFTGDGRFVSYQYDNYGDLINVILPDNTQCQYQYQHYNFLTTNGTTVTTNIDSTHLMTQEIKPDGRIVANVYDSLNRVTNQASTVGTNLVLVTNAYFFYTNNVTSITNQSATGSTLVEDVFHNPTVYYYTNNQITNIVDPYGHSTVQVWYSDTATAPGYPRSLQYTVDKRGLTNQYYYDNFGDVTQMVVLGNLTGQGVPNQAATNTYTYATNHVPLTTIDPIGNGMQFIYDTVDPYKVTQAIRLSGAVQVWTNLYVYTNVGSSAFGLVSSEVLAGLTNNYFYNSNGFRTEQIQYPATAQIPNDSDPPVIHYFSYNLRGQMYQDQIAGGGLTQMDYDAMGRVTSRQVFDQHNNNINSELFYYDLNGELQWYVGPRSNPVDYMYYIHDGAGRVIQQINWRSQGMINGGGVEAPDGNSVYATTFQTFDGFGNNTSVIDPRGIVKTNLFDALGRVLQSQTIAVNGAILKTERFAYEPGDKVTSATNTLGGVTQTLYTQTGQPYFQQNPDGSTNSWTYYLDGRVNQQFLANGSYWLTTYNDASLLITRTFYSGGTTLCTNLAGFDAHGNQILTVDPVGNPFTNVFDGLNRVKYTAGPLMVNILTNVPLPGGATSQTNTFQAASTNFYDAAGLALTNINILGESKISYFDALGRQTEEEFYSPSSTLVRIATTSYSTDHQSQTVTQGSGSTALVKTIYTDNANKPVLTISYPSSGVEEFILDKYDPAENLISETHNTASSGTVITWTTSSFIVDGLNRVISKTDRDGATTTYAYDGASDPTNQVMPGGLTWNAAYNSAQQKLYDFDVGSGGSVTRSNSYTYYSTLGLVQSKTDGRGVTSTHYYDSFLRPTSNVFSGPLPEHNMTVSWAYDPRSLVTSIAQNFASTNTGPSVSVSRSYGMYYEIIRENISGGNSYSATEAYDADVRRTGLGINNFGWGFSYQADGLLTSVGSSSLYGGATFTYSTSGLLLSRLFSPRTTTITQFDGDGRPLAATTTANGPTVLTENLTYTPDGLLASHTLVRPDFTDNRSYTYANLSRRLTQETTGVSASSNWTSAFGYDNGVAGGPGVLTSKGQATGTNVSWKGGTDAFSRVNVATNTVAQREAYGFLNGTATMTALLDGNAMPVSLFGTNDNYEWQAQLSLLPGAHQLVVNALNWSGFYTASATNTFTNNAVDHVQETYAGNGEVTNRVWISSGGKTNATQSLSFDALDRLHSVTYLDTNNNGYIWSAAYDGLGRRMLTTTTFVTNNVVLSNLSKTIGQYYDPNVQFLELGESDSGNTVWKFYGPDVNGTYGGMQGVGGLEAVVNGPRESSPIINDLRGNVLGLYNLSLANTVLFPSRVTAYSAVPGYAPLPVADGALVAQSSAWRGKWPDITGLYCLGNRYYDPTAGNWLSADPIGFNGGPDLYGFSSGDPVNYLDPRGAIATRFVNGVVQAGAVGSDMIGQSAASLAGYGGDYQGYSTLYQNIYNNPNTGPTASDILVGTVQAEANVGTLGLYGMAQGFTTAVETGDYTQAQDASLNSLLMGLGARGEQGEPVTATDPNNPVPEPPLTPAPSPNPNPAPTYNVGEQMPNGQTAGVGPGAQYIGETGDAGDNPVSQFVTSRIDQLQQSIPEAQQGRITMAVAVVEDAAGNQTVLVATSEPGGYLRPGVTLQPGETMVAGTGHAEVDIVNYANENGLTVINIGATRPICPSCQSVIAPTGATVSTPLKPPP
jgi:RHS repeat-associated protein